MNTSHKIIRSEKIGLGEMRRRETPPLERIRMAHESTQTEVNAFNCKLEENMKLAFVVSCNMPQLFIIMRYVTLASRAGEGPSKSKALRPNQRSLSDAPVVPNALGAPPTPIAM